MKKCPKCGAENPDEKKWCRSCMKLLQDTPTATMSHDTVAGKSRLSGSMGSKTYQKPNEQKTAGDMPQSPVSGFAHSAKKEKTNVHITEGALLFGSLGNHKKIEKNASVSQTFNKGTEKQTITPSQSKLRGSVGGKRFKPANTETMIPTKKDPLFIDSDSSMGLCTKCGKTLIKNATLCPHCGKANNNTGERKQKRNTWRIVVFSAACVAIFAIGVLLLFGDNSKGRSEASEIHTYSIDGVMNTHTTIEISNIVNPNAEISLADVKIEIPDILAIYKELEDTEVTNCVTLDDICYAISEHARNQDHLVEYSITTTVQKEGNSWVLSSDDCVDAIVDEMVDNLIIQMINTMGTIEITGGTE